jgi:nitrogen-specific signal transduction histidine kinase
VPIELDADTFLGYRGAATDITAEFTVEQQLRQAQKMEAIGQLTGGLAHDFNNLLGIVSGNVDLLAERLAGDAEALEMVQEVIDAVSRGADLTHRLLQFARRQPLEPSRIDINRLLVDTLKLLRRILDETVEVSFDAAGDLWETVADGTQLQAAIINLATNARDAMARGGCLTMATANESLDEDYARLNPGVEPGDYVCITVTDTGTGMSPEVRAQIFEPFFTTKEQGKGTGLGLSMVYGFLKQSHGHVAVNSELGHGTTFSLYLPRAVCREPAPAEPDPAGTTLLLRGRGERVLVVEDNPSMRRIAARQLRELGYEVLEAANAAAALTLLAAEPIDLLFSDVLMPGGASGFDLAREATRRWPQLHIVLTSGFPNVTQRADMGVPSSVRLLGKPYRKDKLGAVIRNMLDGAP